MDDRLHGNYDWALIADALWDIEDYANALIFHTPTIVATWQDVDLPLYVTV